MPRTLRLRNTFNHCYSVVDNKELENPFSTSGAGLQCTGFSSSSSPCVVSYSLFALRGDFFCHPSEVDAGNWAKNLGFFCPLYFDNAVDCGLAFSQPKPKRHPHYHNPRNMLIILSKKMMANIMRVMLTAKLDEWIVEPLIQDVFLFYYTPPTPHFCISFVTTRESRIQLMMSLLIHSSSSSSSVRKAPSQLLVICQQSSEEDPSLLSFCRTPDIPSCAEWCRCFVNVGN